MRDYALNQSRRALRVAGARWWFGLGREMDRRQHHCTVCGKRADTLHEVCRACRGEAVEARKEEA